MGNSFWDDVWRKNNNKPIDRNEEHIKKAVDRYSISDGETIWVTWSHTRSKKLGLFKSEIITEVDFLISGEAVYTTYYMKNGETVGFRPLTIKADAVSSFLFVKIDDYEVYMIGKTNYALHVGNSEAFLKSVDLMQHMLIKEEHGKNSFSALLEYLLSDNFKFTFFTIEMISKIIEKISEYDVDEEKLLKKRLDYLSMDYCNRQVVQQYSDILNQLQCLNAWSDNEKEEYGLNVLNEKCSVEEREQYGRWGHDFDSFLSFELSHEYEEDLKGITELTYTRKLKEAFLRNIVIERLKYVDINELKSTYDAYLKSTDFDIMLKYWCETKKCKKEDRTFPSEGLYGLNKLHYGILFNDFKIEDFTDNNRQIKLGISMWSKRYENNRDIIELYDYRLLLAITRKWDAFDALYDYTDEAKSIRECIEKTKLKLIGSKILKGVTDFAKDILTEAMNSCQEYSNKEQDHSYLFIEDKEEFEKYVRAKNNGYQVIGISEENQEKYDAIIERRKKIEEFHSKTNEFAEKADLVRNGPSLSEDVVGYYENLINELEKEYIQLKLSAHNSYFEKIKRYKESINPFVRTLIYVYENPEETLCDRMEDPFIYEFSEMHVCMSRGVFERISLDLEQHNFVDDEKEAKIVKPFGEYWFSPDANKDIDILRAEFFCLAKKYHPDVYKGQQMVFVEILKEREKILKALLR